MATDWTDGDVSGSDTLTEADHLYETHINELRVAINALEDIGGVSPFFTVGSSDADYITNGTNDEVEIQQAIDAVFAAGGGIVHMKAETFNIYSPGLAMKDNVILEGEGEGTLLYCAEAASYNVINSGEATEGNPTVSAHYTVLRNFSVDGNKSLVTGSGSILWYLATGITHKPRFENLRIYDQQGVGILLRHCEGALVINCYFSGNLASAVTFYDDCHRCVIDTCTSEDTSGAQAFSLWGAEVEGQSESYDCKIINCTVKGASDDGIWVFEGAHRCIIANNNIDAGQVGIRLRGSTKGSTHYSTNDNVVANNVVINCAAQGIYLERLNSNADVDGNIIIGNRVRDSGVGLYFSAAADNNLYVGNNLQNNITALSDNGTSNTGSGNKV